MAWLTANLRKVETAKQETLLHGSVVILLHAYHHVCLHQEDLTAQTTRSNTLGLIPLKTVERVCVC